MVDKAAPDGLRIQRPDVETRRKFPWLIVLPIAIVALAAVVWLFARGNRKEVRVAPATVIAGQARGSILNASGYVTARRQATVSSKVTGKVVALFIEEGMHVKAGQELARLDAGFASKGHALAQAEATAARSALEETRVRIREAQLDYDRAARLTSSEIASRADLDRARAQLDAVRARLAAQTDQLATAQR